MKYKFQFLLSFCLTLMFCFENFVLAGDEEYSFVWARAESPTGVDELSNMEDLQKRLFFKKISENVDDLMAPRELAKVIDAEAIKAKEDKTGSKKWMLKILFPNNLTEGTPNFFKSDDLLKRIKCAFLPENSSSFEGSLEGEENEKYVIQNPLFEENRPLSPQQKEILERCEKQEALIEAQEELKRVEREALRRRGIALAHEESCWDRVKKMMTQQYVYFSNPQTKKTD